MHVRCWQHSGLLSVVVDLGRICSWCARKTTRISFSFFSSICDCLLWCARYSTTRCIIVHSLYCYQLAQEPIYGTLVSFIITSGSVCVCPPPLPVYGPFVCLLRDLFTPVCIAPLLRWSMQPRQDSPIHLQKFFTSSSLATNWTPELVSHFSRSICNRSNLKPRVDWLAF